MKFVYSMTVCNIRKNTSSHHDNTNKKYIIILIPSDSAKMIVAPSFFSISDKPLSRIDNLDDTKKFFLLQLYSST